MKIGIERNEFTNTFMDKYKSRNIISNLHVVSMLTTKLHSFIARDTRIMGAKKFDF